MQVGKATAVSCANIALVKYWGNAKSLSSPGFHHLPGSHHNFAILRRIAFILLKQEKTAKCGVKAKRRKAGWDEAYLLKVLIGQDAICDCPFDKTVDSVYNLIRKMQ